MDFPQNFDVGDAGRSGKSDNSVVAARMPVHRYASDYNMTHKNRGIALIFNHEDFDSVNLPTRTGTRVDCENLIDSLRFLGFQVFDYHNKTLNEIKFYLNKAAKIDHTDSDCICFCVLSHGEQGYINAKDSPYKAELLWNNFTADKCPSLAGKPKLFFIQACQGDRLDDGVTLQKTETDGDSSTNYKIPIHADFLFAYSTVPGFYSWRNTISGSWFMQSLCAEINSYGKKYDILTLLTFVCQRVALNFESNTPDHPKMHQKKQVPCITSMLTRILKFK